MSLPVTRTILGMHVDFILIIINVLLPLVLLVTSIWIFILSIRKNKTNWLTFILSAISVSFIGAVFFMLGNPETAAYLLAIAMLLTSFGLILSCRK